MHITPHDSWLYCSSYLCLSLKHSCINLPLLLGKLPTYREGHCLISHIAIPFSSEIKENHLALLDEFIVVYIV